MLSKLITCFMLLFSSPTQAEEGFMKFNDASDIPNAIVTFTREPMNSLILTSPDGREAVIDFSGKEVIYSGNLPVAESAKIFFDVVFALYSSCQKVEGK